MLQMPMAVVTSSRRPVVATKLEMAGLTNYFRFSVCGGETAEGKPHPVPYLNGLDQLDLAADQCRALEDSDSGVRSATAAGLCVLQIPDEFGPSAEVRDFWARNTAFSYGLGATLSVECAPSLRFGLRRRSPI